MAQLLAESMLMAITWRNRDGGGIATFEYAKGPISSRPMSQAASWEAATQAFGEDHVIERFDGGCRWTRGGHTPDGRPYR